MRARYLEDSGDRIAVRPAPDDALAGGMFVAFIVAPSVFIAAIAGAWLAFGDDGLLPGWAVGAFGAFVLAVVGLVRIFVARGRAARNEVRIDLSERLIERPGAPPEVLSGIERVTVRRGRGLFIPGWLLELEYEDRRKRTILKVPFAQGGPLAEAAEHLADAIGVETDIAPGAHRARPLATRDPKLAAALTYLPIDGVFAAIAMWFLMTSLDPFVRFHAKQSLANIVAEGVMALLVVGCCGAPIALILPDGMEILGIAMSLALVLALRVTIRVTAAMRAHAGVIWIMPWLPFVRRWTPPPRSKQSSTEP